jgi:predicted nucleic acid-binding protein
VTWLVDTNVISEVRKGARCHPGVAAWWAQVEDRDLFVSALTLGEIRRGIESVRNRDPAKASALERWLRDVSDGFGARIIGVDSAVADVWGRMSAVRSVPVIDALLAATAQVHDLVLVTRNTADVSGLGVKTFNPFDEVRAKGS